MKRLIIFLCLTTSVLVWGQELSADEVLRNATEAAQTLEDAAFLLTGVLIDPDGSEVALEVGVQLIPGAEAARAEFFQPDALADNFVIYSEDAVYNYVFLTNQVSVFNADDPDALGLLFPEGNMEESLDLSLDLERLFEGWTPSAQGYSESPVGNVYTLRFSNGEVDTRVAYVDTDIVDGAWYPYHMTFYSADETVLADITLEDFRRDQGLDPAELSYYPDDAEVIDER